MSVVEKIKQIQTEREREAIDAEATKRSTEQESRAYWETREKFLNSQEKKLLEESGIVGLLKQIETGLLEKTQKNHRIFQVRKSAIVDIQLAWDYQPSQLIDDHLAGYNYNSVNVIIHLDSESMTVNGRELQGEEWHKDTGLVEKTLAEAFLSPNRNNKPQGSMYETGWS